MTWILDLGTEEVVIPGTKSSVESRVLMRMTFAYAVQPWKVRRIKLRK